MATTEGGPAPLGALEVRVRLTPRDGSAAVETATTPSMWAAADEWADGLRAGGEHTDDWLSRKVVQAIELQAAQAEGLMRPGGVSLARIAEMINLYEVEVVGEDGGGGEAPNPAGPGGGA